MPTPTRIHGGQLTDLEGAAGKRTRVLPELAVELRAHSIATLAEMRRTRGDRSGNRGPRATMLAGYETPLDGGEGVFVWDDTSTTPDNAGQGPAGVVQVAGVETGRWVRAQLYPDPIPQHAALLAATRYTTGTGVSHVPNANTVLARIRLWGGGGGGGGAASAGIGQGTVGGGGGAGGYAEWWTAVIPASWTYSVGAGGAAGANTGGNGGSGGNSTVTDGTTTITASGAFGGVGDPTPSATVKVASGGAGGATSTGAPGSPVFIAGSGAQGGHGVWLSSTAAFGGTGGSTGVAKGGPGDVVSGAGVAGLAPGGGGGGALDNPGGGAGANRAGGAGAAGMITIEEFG